MLAVARSFQQISFQCDECGVSKDEFDEFLEFIARFSNRLDFVEGLLYNTWGIFDLWHMITAETTRRYAIRYEDASQIVRARKVGNPFEQKGYGCDVDEQRSSCRFDRMRTVIEGVLADGGDHLYKFDDHWEWMRNADVLLLAQLPGYASEFFGTLAELQRVVVPAMGARKDPRVCETVPIPLAEFGTRHRFTLRDSMKYLSVESPDCTRGHAASLVSLAIALLEGAPENGQKFIQSDALTLLEQAWEIIAGERLQDIFQSDWPIFHLIQQLYIVLHENGEPVFQIRHDEL